MTANVRVAATAEVIELSSSDSSGGQLVIDEQPPPDPLATAGEPGANQPPPAAPGDLGGAPPAAAGELGADQPPPEAPGDLGANQPPLQVAALPEQPPQAEPGDLGADQPPPAEPGDLGADQPPPAAAPGNLGANQPPPEAAPGNLGANQPPPEAAPGNLGANQPPPGPGDGQLPQDPPPPQVPDQGDIVAPPENAPGAARGGQVGVGIDLEHPAIAAELDANAEALAAGDDSDHEDEEGEAVDRDPVAPAVRNDQEVQRDLRGALRNPPPLPGPFPPPAPVVPFYVNQDLAGMTLDEITYNTARKLLTQLFCNFVVTLLLFPSILQKYLGTAWHRPATPTAWRGRTPTCSSSTPELCWRSPSVFPPLRGTWFPCTRTVRPVRPKWSGTLNSTRT